MPQGAIKLSRKKRSKMSKKVKNISRDYEKGLVDAAFMLSESS
jgi:hypothetical protein